MVILKICQDICSYCAFVKHDFQLKHGKDLYFFEIPCAFSLYLDGLYCTWELETYLIPFEYPAL